MAKANPAKVIIVDPEPFFYEKMHACLRWTPLSRHKMVKNKVELSPL
jgi:hypothetical protein